MSTYLVTGVAGFIASRVAELLLADGQEVVGIDNLNDYYDVRLKDYRLARLLAGAGEGQSGKSIVLGADPKRSVYANHQSPVTGHSGSFIFRHLDIEDLVSLDGLFAAHKFDAVINLAARAGVRASLERPDLYQRTNVLGEENVLRCQVKYGVRKHVLASSSSVYAGCPMPFTEEARLGVMQSPYAETKRQAEFVARRYFQDDGLDVSVLRYFTVFGPAGRPDMAPLRFVKWIAEGTPITLYGDGTQARDFTYVDDIARGTILASQLSGGRLAGEKPETGRRLGGDGEAKLKPEDSGANSGLSTRLTPGYDVINLGGGNNPLSLHAVIAIIEQAVGRKAQISGQPPSAVDMKETWADISKAERLLGWKPQITPEDGFRRTVAWYLANQGWLKDIRL